MAGLKVKRKPRHQKLSSRVCLLRSGRSSSTPSSSTSWSTTCLSAGTCSSSASEAITELAAEGAVDELLDPEELDELEEESEELLVLVVDEDDEPAGELEAYHSNRRAD